MVACIKRCEVALQSQSRQLISAHCDIPIAVHMYLFFLMRSCGINP